MTTTRFCHTEIECSYTELPKSYFYLKKLGYDATEITKERISPCRYRLTAHKRW